MSLLYTSMIRHCYVPNDFCNSVIIPLLKSKHGDATNLDTYRGITLSPVLSKVFESVLLLLYDDRYCLVLKRTVVAVMRYLQ